MKKILFTVLTVFVLSCDNNPGYARPADVDYFTDTDNIEDSLLVDDGLFYEPDDNLSVDEQEDIDSVDIIWVTPDEDMWSECGNGIVEGNEDCDDQNQDNTDGCYTNCQSNNPPIGAMDPSMGTKVLLGWACDIDDTTSIIVEIKITFEDADGFEVYGLDVYGIMANHLYDTRNLSECYDNNWHGWGFDATNRINEIASTGARKPYMAHAYARDPEAALVDKNLEWVELDGSPKGVW